MSINIVPEGEDDLDDKVLIKKDIQDVKLILNLMQMKLPLKNILGYNMFSKNAENICRKLGNIEKIISWLFDKEKSL